MKTVGALLETKKINQIVFVEPSTTVLAAVQILGQGNFGALPVVANNRLVGIFSERDYTRKIELAGKASASTRVEEVMTPNPFAVTREDTLEKCMTLMTEKGFRHLPVVDADHRAIGMISIKDVVASVLLDKEALLDTAVHVAAQGRGTQDRALQRFCADFRAVYDPLRGQLQKANQTDSVRSLDALFQQVDRLTQNKKRLQNAKVLLVTESGEEEVIGKLALGGTGVELHTASELQVGKDLIRANSYDIICLNSHSLGLGEEARKLNPQVKILFMTSEDIQTYVSILKAHPYLSNVVAQSKLDRHFTVRSILSTVSKIINEDFFGMEKYLNWGTEIFEHPVRRSEERPALLAQMEEFLRGIGLRGQLIRRCVNVGEEMLMNAIYDAPVDAKGNRLFNHLPRTEGVELSEEKQAYFRYGCDGMFFGVSVRDPFGSLDRATILDYVESNAEGKESALHANKGGGGHGLFIILRSGNLTVFNVQPGLATEVIVLFDISPKEDGAPKKSSFHYFEGSPIGT